MKTYLYSINVESEMPGVLFVSFVAQDFWEEEHCMDDQTPEELIDALEPHGFSEAMESVFEYEGDMAQMEEILQSLGMRQDDEFNALCANDDFS